MEKIISYPNLETEHVCQLVESDKSLTMFDVKGALLSNCPQLPKPYSDFLKMSIDKIDWGFVDDYLRPKLGVENE